MENVERGIREGRNKKQNENRVGNVKLRCQPDREN